jgi:hypothetical protein
LGTNPASLKGKLMSLEVRKICLWIISLGNDQVCFRWNELP